MAHNDHDAVFEKGSHGSDKDDGQYVTTTTADQHDSEFYDPSKESIWTRLGVNFESFKPAPGTTG
jgi:amino acid transporter